MNHKVRREDALAYHAEGRPGKLEVVPTKPYSTQRDLTLAYSPGVAEPCLAIAENVEDVYKYTAKGNLVAVISNGTAVLGLGDIGPEASKPVMEGKGLLFKIYADIDVFDIELDTKNVDDFVKMVKMLQPTFGGINLEDIKAPECFEIEERLKRELSIPIMHDDQHGTAIISAAALLNALELVGKSIDEVKIVINGAGASAISCTKLYVSLGARIDNIVMCDSKGVIRAERTDLDERKALFATHRDLHTLTEAFVDADVFVGLSKGNVVNPAMIQSMASDPIVFAMANPTPEISYEEAMAARPDVIMATGRSDYPNQVNNVLGFPYIFRGALDVRATEINEAMKLAAVHALADLAKKTVPDLVNMAYGESNLRFSRTYIIPKPVDPRLLVSVAPAVARAAMASGVARHPITDWDEYELQLSRRLGKDNQLARVVQNKAKANPGRVVFADAENLTVLKAARQVLDDGIALPILLGDVALIRSLLTLNDLDLGNSPIIDPRSPEQAEQVKAYSELFYQKRFRKGISMRVAARRMTQRSYFGVMMVETGEADAFISGLNSNYPDTIRPALEVIGKQTGVKKVAGLYILLTKNGPLFLADTTVNFNPTAEEIVEITELTARAVEHFNLKPRIAMVTYSNFGSAKGEDAEKMNHAVELLQAKRPDLLVDGEMQAHLAFDTDLLRQNYPLSRLVDEGANTLIFPNLSSANIAYNLLSKLAGFDAIGPVLLGLRKPVHVLQVGSSEREIVNMVAIAVAEARTKFARHEQPDEATMAQPAN